MKKLFLIPLLALSLLAMPLLARPAHAQPPAQSPQQAAAQVVERMRAEKLTPQQLWDQELLTKSLLLRVMDDAELLDGPRSLWRQAPEGTAFVELLLKECPEMLEPPLSMGTNARIRLMQYLEAKKDPRIAVFLENTLDSLVGTGVRLSTVSSMLATLSRHYRDTGELQKACDTPYRIQEFTEWPRAIAEVFLHAALVACINDEPKEAFRLWKELESYKDGWATGLAYQDAASYFSRQGKIEEARTVLRTPFQGNQEDAFRIITRIALAELYVKTKEWDEARSYVEAALEELNKMSAADKLKRELNGLDKTAQSILDKLNQQK